jgi:hypothetical protein
MNSLTHPHTCALVHIHVYSEQIQLLVSADEIENYRDITEAMDALRLVTESKLDRVVQLRKYVAHTLGHSPLPLAQS